MASGIRALRRVKRPVKARTRKEKEKEKEIAKGKSGEYTRAHGPKQYEIHELRRQRSWVVYNAEFDTPEMDRPRHDKRAGKEEQKEVQKLVSWRQQQFQ